MARRFDTSKLIFQHATQNGVIDDQNQIYEHDYVKAQNPDGS